MTVASLLRTTERLFCNSIANNLATSNMSILPTCPVSGLLEVGPEGPGLVVPDPLGGGAVIVVGEHVVVVRVEAGQHGGARRAAHGRRGETVLELRALLVQVAVLEGEEGEEAEMRISRR